MPNPSPKRIRTTSAALWVAEDVDRWIRLKIKGLPWSPAEVDNPTFIRKPEVMRRVGLSYVTIWYKEKAGEFPKHIHLCDVVDSLLQRRDAEAAE